MIERIKIMNSARLQHQPITTLAAYQYHGGCLMKQQCYITRHKKLMKNLY